MECREVQERLCAYLEGSLPPQEKMLIEEHLRPCQKCSQSLAELSRTVERLQGLPEAEPPPWLAQKIMARVRSEAETRRGIWQILFYPIHVKLPLEAVGVIAIAVTTIYLFKAMQPEMHLSKEPLEGMRPPAVSEVAKSPISPESKVPPTIPGTAPVPSPVPMPERQLPMAESGAGKGAYDQVQATPPERRDETAPPRAEFRVTEAEPEGAHAPPAASRQEIEKPKAPPPAAETLAGAGAREEWKAQAPSTLPSSEEHDKAVKRGELGRSRTDLSAALQAKALAEKKELGLHFTLEVKDTEAAIIEIEKGIADLGGRILQKDRQESKTTVVAELSSDQLETLLNKLKPVGEVKGGLTDFRAKEGAQEIVRIEILEMQ